MSHKNRIKCEPEMKWALFTAGIDTDPVTLAKHLTHFCTAAFSATVLYVAYSNSKKRPQFNQYTQCTQDLLSDHELSDEDQITLCENSIVESNERTGPPHELMIVEIPFDDAQCPPSTQAHCPPDPTVEVDMAKDGLEDEFTTRTDTRNLQIQPSTASYCLASDLIFATNDAYTSAGVRQDETRSVPSIMESVDVYGIGNAGTQTMPSIMASAFNSSSDLCGIDNAETQTVPLIMELDLDPSLCTCGVYSAETQTVPSTMESVLNAPCGVRMAAEAFVGGTLSSVESLCSQNQPQTISTASGPDGIAACRLDDTCYCSGFSEDPDCTKAKDGFLRHFKEGELPVRNCEGLDSLQCDSLGEENDHGSHFEGYVCGKIREKGSNSYKRRLYRGILFSERWEQGDGGCSGERTDLGGSDHGVKFHEACTQVKSGVQVCENISIEKPQKIVGGNKKKDLDFLSSLDGCANNVGESSPWQCDSYTQTKAANNGASIPVDSCSSREASTGQLMKQFPAMTKPDKNRFLGNNFECSSGKFVDTLSPYYSTSGPRGEGVLKQLPITAREVTRHFMGNSFEKCRDKGTNISVEGYPAYRTRGAWAGRPCRQPRAISKEKTFQSIDNSLGVVERCVEERCECGIACDPFEKTKSSLKTLTETQHWSKMCRPEQYERLGLLDSTLAAASEQLNGRGKRNITYWKHKDSAPLSKFSALSTLYNSQDSTECPTVDFQEDVNCTCSPSSTSSQVEQYCAEVTCLEAQQILHDKQVRRAGNLQQSSISTTCNSLSYRPPRSTQNNFHDESDRSANISAESRRMHSEAARETRTLSKLMARNTR